MQAEHPDGVVQDAGVRVAQEQLVADAVVIDRRAALVYGLAVDEEVARGEPAQVEGPRGGAGVERRVDLADDDERLVVEGGGGVGERLAGGAGGPDDRGRRGGPWRPGTAVPGQQPGLVEVGARRGRGERVRGGPAERGPGQVGAQCLAA